MRAPTLWKMPDAERARGALAVSVQVGLSRLQMRDDRVRVAEEEGARIGQRDAPRTARTLDEPLPDDPLELGDLLADRGLRVAELARRRVEGGRAPHRLQGREVAQLDAAPSINPGHRSRFMIETNSNRICAYRLPGPR